MKSKYGEGKKEQYVIVHKDGKTFKRRQIVGEEKVFESNLVNDYLVKILSITSGKQNDFYTWQLNMAKSVKPVRTDSLNNEYINKSIDKYPPVIKQCFLNAYHLAKMIPNCKYVEGLVSFHGIAIEHAWNKIGNKYFDATYDYAIEHGKPFDEYVSILELDKKEVVDIYRKIGEYGSVMKEFFRQNEEDKKIKKGFNLSIEELFSGQYETEIQKADDYETDSYELQGIMYDIEEIEKGGKKATIGEIRIRANGIKEQKTFYGWKYLGKVDVHHSQVEIKNDIKEIEEDRKEIEKPEIENGEIKETSEPIEKKVEFKPSNYQQAIYDFINTGSGNAAVDAKAGSGKTTTIVNALKHIPKDKKICFVAFAKDIVKELSEKMPDYVDLSTLHSFGSRAIKNAYGRNVAINNDKKFIVLNNHVSDLADKAGLEEGDRNEYIQNIFKLVSLAKQNLTYDQEELIKEGLKQGMNILADETQHIKKCLLMLYNRKDMIDFDDMIYLPAIDPSISVKKYDWVFVDECQDLNKMQHRMLSKMYSNEQGGRFIAVGDPQQAIFGFAGSDEKSFENIANLPNTKTLPLSVSYRCAKSIIDYVVAKTGVPIEAAENAKLGIVDENASISNVKPGDMVLCRNTAPLVALCMKFISEKKAASIKGRDMGDVLVNQIKRYIPKSMLDKEEGFGLLNQKLDGEIVKLKEKLKQRGLREQQLEDHPSIVNIRNRQECYNVLRDDSKTPNHMIKNINDIFKESKEGKNGIQLSTCHRSKGLEADNVFVVEDDLLHGTRATNDFQKIQEKNLRYVTYTRAKNYLGIVGDWFFYPKVKKAFFDDIEKANKKTHYSDVLVEYNGKILFLFRNKKDGNKFLDSKYCFPGGHIDKNEDEKIAAQRELVEETNIECHINDLTKIYEYESDDVKICYYHLCLENEPNIILNNDEHNNYVWVLPEKAIDLYLIADLGDYIDVMISCIVLDDKKIKLQLPPEQTGSSEQVYNEFEKSFRIIEQAYNEDKVSFEVFLKARESYLKNSK